MTRRSAPNRNDALVDKDGRANLRFAQVIEDLVEDVNDLGVLPINTQNNDYTLVIEDAGSIIRKTSSITNQVYTIPANAVVEFDIGTGFEVQNDGSVAMSVAIITDTLTSEADGTTGTRTIGPKGSAEFRKVTATEWKIRGQQLT